MFLYINIISVTFLKSMVMYNGVGDFRIVADDDAQADIIGNWQTIQRIKLFFYKIWTITV